MATLFDIRLSSIINADSSIEAGAKLYWYTSGTTTAVNTFTTEALSVANSNPVVADANGRFPSIWLGPGSYKYILTAADSTPADPIITQDPFIAPNLPPTIDSDLSDFLAGTSPLPIANGGTGPSLLLPVANGGTGVTTVPDIKTLLGITTATAAATAAEVVAGTVTDKYVPPYALGHTTRSIASPAAWHIWRSDGMLEQGGTGTTGANGWSADILFPIPFPTICLNLSATQINVNPGGTNSDNVATNIVDESTFQLGCNDVAAPVSWRAIGY